MVAVYFTMFFFVGGGVLSKHRFRLRGSRAMGSRLGGLELQGLGFGVYGLGFRLGFRVRVRATGFFRRLKVAATTISDTVRWLLALQPELFGFRVALNPKALRPQNPTTLKT